MKNKLPFILVFLLIFIMTGCKADLSNVTIDYGNSSLYTQDDMNEAIDVIESQFSTWDGCVLHNIRYSSDSECNPDNIAWMNELERANANQEHFTECIMFKTDFRSPLYDKTATWNTNYEYKDYQWWLARSDGGDWKLMTWGY